MNQHPSAKKKENSNSPKRRIVTMGVESKENALEDLLSSNGESDLVVFLQKKRLKLLPAQRSALKFFQSLNQTNSSTSLSRRLQILCEGVKWSVGALLVDVGDDETWDVFAATFQALVSNDKWGSALSSKDSQKVLNLITERFKHASPLSSHLCLSLLKVSRLTLSQMKVAPNTKTLASIIEHCASHLQSHLVDETTNKANPEVDNDASSYLFNMEEVEALSLLPNGKRPSVLKVTSLTKIALEMLQSLSSALEPLPPKKRFETICSSILNALARIRRTANLHIKNTPSRLLPDLTISTATKVSHTMDEKWLPNTLKKDFAEVLSSVDLILRKALFQPENLEFLKGTCTAWSDGEKDKSPPKKKGPEATAYTIQLFKAIEEKLGEKDSVAAMADLLPVLVEQLALRKQADSRAIAEEPTSSSKKRRRDYPREGSLEILFFFRLASLLTSKSKENAHLLRVNMLLNCARLLRVAIQYDLYDVSSKVEFNSFLDWFYEILQSWDQELVTLQRQSGKETEEESILFLELSAKVVIVASLLELDHRIVQDKLTALFRFAYQNFPFAVALETNNNSATPRSFPLPAMDIPDISFNPSTELILRLVEVYSRLRQISTLFPLFAASIDEMPNVEDRFVAVHSFVSNMTTTKCISLFFSRTPSPQIAGLWDTMEKSLKTLDDTLPKTSTVLLKQFLTAHLFATVIESLNVNERNVLLLRQKALQVKRFVEPTLKTSPSVSSATKKNRDGHVLELVRYASFAVLLQSALALLRICDAWKYTSAEFDPRQDDVVRDHVIETSTVFSISQTFQALQKLCPVSSSPTSINSAEKESWTASGVLTVFSRVSCKIAAGCLRDSRTDPACSNADKEMLLRIFTRDIDQNNSVILEHLSVIDLVPVSSTRDTICIQLWNFIIKTAFGDLNRDASTSPLCSAAFFELKSFQATVGQGALDFVSENPFQIDTVCNLLAGLPDGYLLRESITILAEFLQDLTSPGSGACNLLTSLIRRDPTLLERIPRLQNLAHLRETFLRIDAAPNLRLAVQISFGMLQRHPDTLESAMTQLLEKESKSDFDKALLLAFLQGSGDLRRMRALNRREQSPPLLSFQEKLAKFAAALPPTDPFRAGALAFLLDMQGLPVQKPKVVKAFFDSNQIARLAAPLSLETLRHFPQKCATPHFILLRALGSCAFWIPDLKDEESLKLLSEKILQAVSAAPDAFAESILMEAAHKFFATVSVEDQLPVILRHLVEALEIARQPCFPARQKGTAEAAVKVIRKVCPALLRDAACQALFGNYKYSLLSALICLGCSASSVLDLEHQLLCLQSVKLILLSYPAILHGSKLRSARLILDGISTAIPANLSGGRGSAASARLFLATCDLFFAVVRSRIKALSKKCASLVLTVFQVLTTCVAEHTRDQTGSVHPAWIEGIAMLSRTAEELTAYKKVYSHHAVYWLSNFLVFRKAFPLPTVVASALEQVAFHYLDVCSNFELQQVHISSDDAGRALFKSLRELHEESHVFRGKV